MRDFFYNKGDVFIAVLIILVAAAVIYMRVGIIMEYSAYGGKNDGLFPLPSFLSGLKEKPAGETGGVKEGANGAAAGTPAQMETPQVQPEDGLGQAETPPASSETPPVSTETPPVSSETIQITVDAGDAASTIADKLFAAGAIADKQAFLSDVMSQGADSKLKIGTFVIPAGSSHTDIIKILVG